MQGDATYKAPEAPNGWAIVSRDQDGNGYRRILAPNQTVIISRNRERDGKLWVHLSMKVGHRLPTWSEMVDIKEAFLGPESMVIQCLPPRSQWVNHDEFVMHLWMCEDPIIPDFRGENGLI